MTHAALLDDARQQLELTFARASAERSMRQTFEASGELGWVLHERASMLGTVNRIRSERGLKPVAEDDILAVERSALGHSDYATKLTFRCAELTVPIS